MDTAVASNESTEMDQALAILMFENASDLDSATCALAGSALSQGIPMEQVAATIVAMAGRSAAPLG